MMHRNEVRLVGRVSRPPRDRRLPSGDQMMMWGLAVRRPPGHPSSKKSDGIACVAFDPEVAALVARWRVDDVVSVEGALHHRFWSGPGGGASTYEVEVHRVSTVEPAGPPRNRPSARTAAAPEGRYGGHPECPPDASPAGAGGPAASAGLRTAGEA